MRANVYGFKHSKVKITFVIRFNLEERRLTGLVIVIGKSDKERHFIFRKLKHVHQTINDIFRFTCLVYNPCLNCTPLLISVCTVAVVLHVGTSRKQRDRQLGVAFIRKHWTVHFNVRQTPTFNFPLPIQMVRETFCNHLEFRVTNKKLSVLKT